MEKEEEKAFSVWINQEDRIVSFEKVKGFEKLEFQSNEDKLRFVVEKGSLGYRIQ